MKIGNKLVESVVLSVRACEKELAKIVSFKHKEYKTDILKLREDTMNLAIENLKDYIKVLEGE